MPGTGAAQGGRRTGGLLRHCRGRVLLTPDGSRPNLSMLLRPNPVANSESAREVAAVRLSFPDDPGRNAGKNFQAPRLPARARDGGRGTRPELDGVFAS